MDLHLGRRIGSLGHDDAIAIDPQRDDDAGIVGVDRHHGGMQEPASRGVGREVLLDQPSEHLGETARLGVDERDDHGASRTFVASRRSNRS